MFERAFNMLFLVDDILWRKQRLASRMGNNRHVDQGQINVILPCSFKQENYTSKTGST